MFLALCVGNPAAHADPPAPYPAASTFETEFRKPVKMNYWVILPENYEDSTETFPLLLWLHGAGAHDDPEEIWEYGPPEMWLKGRRFPFIILVPQLWADVHWDPDAVHALLQDTIKTHRVDTGRIWLMGYSRGGFGAWEMAVSYPDTFCAVVPISARAMVAVERCAHMGIWMFAGADDTGVPVEETRNMYHELKTWGKAQDVHMTIFEGVGHAAVGPAMQTEELWTWLVKHRRK